MSYDISFRGNDKVYTLSDEQGEELKNVLKMGKRDDFIEFGALMFRVGDVKTVEHILSPRVDRSQLLDDPYYTSRGKEGIKSVRETIYKHTKDLKARGILSQDKIFDVEKEFEKEERIEVENIKF